MPTPPDKTTEELPIIDGEFTEVQEETPAWTEEKNPIDLVTEELQEKFPLATVINESGLEQSKANRLLEIFKDYFQFVAQVELQARGLKVTNASQTVAMGQARVLRLSLREKRVAAENLRKEMKQQSLLEGRAIDGAANIIKAMIEPLEKYLLNQEKFVEIQQAEEEKRLLEEARARQEEERKAKEKEEEERRAAEREELERLRKENEEKEKALNVAREKEEQERTAREHAEREKKEAEEKAQREQEAREKAEREKEEAQKKAEQERVAREKADQERAAAEEKAAKEKARLAEEKEAAAQAARLVCCPKCGHQFDPTEDDRGE